MEHIKGEANKQSYLYSAFAAEIVKKICAPLKYLNIRGFGYFKIFNDGSYIHITNGLLDFQKIYFEQVENLGVYEKRYQSIPYGEKRHLVWHYPYDYIDDKIAYISKESGFRQGIDFYIRNNNNIENFYFILAGESDLKKQFLQDPAYISCLEEFIYYFKDKARDLINCSDKSKLAKYTGKIDINYYPEINYTQKLSTFLNCIGANKLRIPKSKMLLTEKELEIFRVVYLSNKEIANRLNLSPRTIENHINNIKKKIGVGHKSQLGDFIFKNRSDKWRSLFPNGYKEN